LSYYWTPPEDAVGRARCRKLARRVRRCEAMNIGVTLGYMA
jgi:hypothetical protein